MENWQLCEECYQVVVKAVESDKRKRWKTFAEFSRNGKIQMSYK